MLKLAPQDASRGNGGVCVRRGYDGRLARLVHMPPAKGAKSSGDQENDRQEETPQGEEAQHRQASGEGLLLRVLNRPTGNTRRSTLAVGVVGHGINAGSTDEFQIGPGSRAVTHLNKEKNDGNQESKQETPQVHQAEPRETVDSGRQPGDSKPLVRSELCTIPGAIAPQRPREHSTA